MVGDPFAAKFKLSTFMQIKQGNHSKRLSCFAVCTVILAQVTIVFFVNILHINFPYKRRTKFIFYPFKNLNIKLIIHKDAENDLQNVSASNRVFGRLKGGCSGVPDQMDMGKFKGLPKEVYPCALHYGSVSDNVHTQSDFCEQDSRYFHLQ